MNSSSRDLRSLAEKLHAAEMAFAELKGKAAASGKKIVNISAVAKLAQIDRGYLYGKIDTPNEDIKAKFAKLGNEIIKFKKNFSVLSSEQSPKYKSEIDRLKHDLDTSIKQNAKLLFQHREMKEQYETVCQQRDLQIDNLTKVERKVFELQAKEGGKPTKMASGGPVGRISPPVVIISPDLHLMIKGECQSSDPYLRKEAWAQAEDQLKDELRNPTPTSLYLTIGIQCSGKSTWARAYSPEIRRGIIFDATNLTMADRFDILHIARTSGHQDLQICAVCFPIDPNSAKERNKERPAVRRIPGKVIDDANDVIEFPAVTGHLAREKFDAILIVRERR